MARRNDPRFRAGAETCEAANGEGPRTARARNKGG